MVFTENDVRKLCDQYRDTLYNRLMSKTNQITVKNGLIIKYNMILCADKVYNSFKKSLIKKTENKKRVRDEDHDTDDDSDQDNMEY